MLQHQDHFVITEQPFWSSEHLVPHLSNFPHPVVRRHPTSQESRSTTPCHTSFSTLTRIESSRSGIQDSQQINGTISEELATKNMVSLLCTSFLGTRKPHQVKGVCSFLLLFRKELHLHWKDWALRVSAWFSRAGISSLEPSKCWHESTGYGCDLEKLPRHRESWSLVYLCAAQPS